MFVKLMLMFYSFHLAESVGICTSRRPEWQFLLMCSDGDSRHPKNGKTLWVRWFFTVSEHAMPCSGEFDM